MAIPLVISLFRATPPLFTGIELSLTFIGTAPASNKHLRERTRTSLISPLRHREPGHTWFAQMITINFAMVVAIYYFLHQAKVTLKIFTFFAYTTGMLVLFSQMVVEANVKEGTIGALRSLFTLSRSAIRYRGL